MSKFETLINKPANRRAFLKTGISAAGAATMDADHWVEGYPRSARATGDRRKVPQSMEHTAL
jgi:hypothetical protein